MKENKMFTRNYTTNLAKQFFRLIIVFGLAMVFIYFFWGCASTGMEQGYNGTALQDTSLNEYDLQDLNAYGDWVHIDRFGRVWQPSVVDGWEPFYYGNWLYTNNGWAWDSYEPFGWIVYHYGDWYYDPEYHWVWIPGYQWSPARVRWLDYGDYICWAPIPPPGVIWPEPWQPTGFQFWITVNMGDFTRDRVGQFRIMHPRAREEREIRRGMDRPPDRNLIERYTHQPVRKVQIRREPIQMAHHQIHRMRLPDQEEQRVERYRQEVEHEALRPNFARRNQHETQRREEGQRQSQSEHHRAHERTPKREKRK